MERTCIGVRICGVECLSYACGYQHSSVQRVSTHAEAVLHCDLVTRVIHIKGEDYSAETINGEGERGNEKA